MRLVIAISLAILMQIPALAVRQTGAISGIAIDRLTKRPLSDVQVELRLQEAAGAVAFGPVLPRVFRSAPTADDGAFRFESVPPGNYQLVFRHDQYLNTVFIRSMIPSLKGEPLPETLLQVAPGQTIAGLRARLTPSGTIRGNVRKPDGSPLMARVTAFAPATAVYIDGRPNESILEARASVLANERGEYRLTGLAPGPYFLRATAVPPGTRNTEPGIAPLRLGPDGSIQGPAVQTVQARACDVPGSGIASRYYPATASPDEAAVLDLPPGVSRDAVDFILSPSTGRTVSGSVFQTEGVGEASPVTVELVSRSPFPESETVSCRLPSMGAFSIRDVLAGDYFLKVSTPSASRTESIRVGNDDLSVRIALDASPSQTTFFGKIVRSEGMTWTPPLNFPAIRLQIYPLGPLAPHSPVRGSVLFPSADGTFAGSVPPSVYALDLPVRPASCCPPERLSYAETIRLNNADASDGVLRLPEGTSVSLEIKVADSVGFFGRVVDQDGAALENAVVALVPNPPLRNRLDLYRNAVTGAGGTFAIIAPRGDFKVLSREGVDAKGWENPAILRAYDSFGSSVVIGDAGVRDFEVVVRP